MEENTLDFLLRTNDLQKTNREIIQILAKLPLNILLKLYC